MSDQNVDLAGYESYRSADQVSADAFARDIKEMCAAARLEVPTNKSFVYWFWRSMMFWSISVSIFFTKQFIKVEK